MPLTRGPASRASSLRPSARQHRLGQIGPRAASPLSIMSIMPPGQRLGGHYQTMTRRRSMLHFVGALAATTLSGTGTVSIRTLARPPAIKASGVSSDHPTLDSYRLRYFRVKFGMYSSSAGSPASPLAVQCAFATGPGPAYVSCCVAARCIVHTLTLESSRPQDPEAAAAEKSLSRGLLSRC